MEAMPGSMGTKGLAGHELVVAGELAAEEMGADAAGELAVLKLSVWMVFGLGQA